jgi:hypothetical protein
MGAHHVRSDRRHRLKAEVRLEMRIGKLEHATKVNALCLPPVVISLVGLAALSRKKGGTIVAGRKISPGVKRPLHGSS